MGSELFHAAARLLLTHKLPGLKLAQGVSDTVTLLFIDAI